MCNLARILLNKLYNKFCTTKYVTSSSRCKFPVYYNHHHHHCKSHHRTEECCSHSSHSNHRSSSSSLRNYHFHHKLQPRRSRNSWTRAIVIGLVVFFVYFLLLCFISYLAISTHRSSRSSLSHYVTKNVNGSVQDSDYGMISANGSFHSHGLLALERVGNVKFSPFTRRDLFGAELIRSQMIFKCASPIHFRNPLIKRPAVALVSFPGSGNTWLRYLLQLSTGIYTGSVYKDFALLRNGFPGEYVRDGRVLVVKTHETGPLIRAQYDKAILLIRKPSEAILAEFNRRSAGHIGQAGRDKYRKSDGRYWSQFVVQKARSWTETNLDWIEHFNGPLLIMMYSHLVSNVSNELRTTLEFLQEPVSDEVMTCVLRNKEGIYRRRKRFSDFNPYTSKMSSFLTAQEEIVGSAIEKRIESRLERLRKT